MKKIIKYLPTFSFFSFITWMVIQADMDKENIIMKVGHAIPWGDKIGHFILFGLLALLLNIALKFKQVRIYKRVFHLGSVIVFSFAVAEEFSQLAFSTRTFDVIDMLFDLFGIGVLSSVAFRKFLIKKLQELTRKLVKSLCLDKNDLT